MIDDPWLGREGAAVGVRRCAAAGGAGVGAGPPDDPVHRGAVPGRRVRPRPGHDRRAGRATPTRRSWATLAELALFAVLFTDGMRVGWADLRCGVAAARPGAGLGPAADPAGHRAAGPLRRRAGLAGGAADRRDPGPDRPGVRRRAGRQRQGAGAGCGTCSTSSPASTTAWRCRSSWCSSPSPPARTTCTWASSALELVARHRDRRGCAVGGDPAGAHPLLRRLRPRTSRSTRSRSACWSSALGKATHGNLFLAAFAAGITVATFGPRQRAAFEHFGELVAELFKLAALLVFGAL